MHQVIERVLGFMSRGTTDAIFIIPQLQGKYLPMKKKFDFYLNLRKSFESAPGKVIWCVMRTLGVEERVMLNIAAFYDFTSTSVRVNRRFNEKIGVKVGVRQWSMLSPLLFIIFWRPFSEPLEQVACGSYCTLTTLRWQSIRARTELLSLKIWSETWFLS